MNVDLKDSQDIKIEQDGSIIYLKLNKDYFYPVGSIYETSENKNPSSIFGGSWTLIDKKFKKDYQNITDGASEYFQVNATHATLNSFTFVREDNIIQIRISLTNKVELADSEIQLGVVNLDKLGVSRFTYTMNQTGHLSDGGNGLVNATLSNDTGALTSLDVICKGTATSIPANSTIIFNYIINMYSNYMLDSACSRFIWKRTS